MSAISSLPLLAKTNPPCSAVSAITTIQASLKNLSLKFTSGGPLYLCGPHHMHGHLLASLLCGHCRPAPMGLSPSYRDRREPPSPVGAFESVVRRLCQNIEILGEFSVINNYTHIRGCFMGANRYPLQAYHHHHHHFIRSVAVADNRTIQKKTK